MMMKKNSSMLISSRADYNINGNGGGGVLIESSSSSVIFVDDIEYMVVEILSRLPVKSLLRFKCVSKRWCSLIQDPYFVDLHSARSITRPGATFFISRDHRGRNITFFGSTLYDGPHFHSVDYVSFIGDPARSLDTFGPHFFTERYHDFTGYGKLTYTQILNGLLFMSFKEETVWIMNPSTRKTILLTKTNIKEEEAINNKDVVRPGGIHWMNLELVVEPEYGFGFDPVTKKYKVICICMVYIFYVPPQYFLYDPSEGIEHEFHPQHLTSYYRCKVLTIEEDVVDCCWRRIDEIPPRPLSSLTGDPVYLKGALFWRGKYKDDDDEVIVAFDISTEKFSLIKTPADFVRKPSGLTSVIQAFNQELYEVDGYLAILDNNNTTGPNMIQVWKLVVVPPPPPEAADAAATVASCSCWVKETILTLSFDWRKERYLFEVIGGTNQILLKHSKGSSYDDGSTNSFCYYNRDNYFVEDHGNETKKKTTSTCDVEKQLEFTGKAALFTEEIIQLPARCSGINYRTFHTCTESLWSLNSSSN